MLCAWVYQWFFFFFFFFFFNHSFILHRLERRTRPIWTPYDGRRRWDLNLRTPACESPALPLCYGMRTCIVYGQKQSLWNSSVHKCKELIVETCTIQYMSQLFLSLAKEVMFLVALVSLSVCLSVCLSVDNITQKVMNGLGWNFYGRILSSTRKNWLNFGGDLGIVRWVNEQKNSLIVVAYPDRGEGNDPEPLFFFFFFFFRGVGSLSQPRLNIFAVGNMRVMICLGQGGLCSLSASSFTCNLLLSDVKLRGTNFEKNVCCCLYFLYIILLRLNNEGFCAVIDDMKKLVIEQPISHRAMWSGLLPVSFYLPFLFSGISVNDRVVLKDGYHCAKKPLSTR